MKMNLQHITRVGLVISVLTMTFIGCAYISGVFKGEEQEVAPPKEGKPPASHEKKPESSQPEEVQPPADRTYFVHTVTYQGETLSIIAGWYTGSIENWKELARVNPGINAERIFQGNRIYIPEDLMKTREPMPKKYVASFLPEPKEEAAPAESVPKPEEEEELKLFGPKEYPPQ